MAVTGILILSIFVLILPVIRCGRILVYVPTPSISHQVVFRPLTKALAARGHEVIVVTPNPAFPPGKAPQNLTEIDVHDVSYKDWEELFIYHQGKKEEVMSEVELMIKRFGIIFDQQLQTAGVREIINKDKNYFDLMILEGCNRGLLALAHKFNAPIALISSFGAVSIQYSVLGAPTHPLLYPTAERQRLYNLSLIEKAVELFKYISLYYIVFSTEQFDLSIMRKHFGDEVPNFEVLGNRIIMMLLNEHPIWADNRPVPRNIIYIGGIHQTEEMELPKDLRSYLDSSKHGVIYVSFGTNVIPSQLPAEKIEMMARALSELPYDVLWKYDKDVLPGQSKNIKLSKWFPQSDLLRHPKIKLFVTQGGLQSTDEAITAAVPLLGIPLSSDQWYNVEKYIHHKIGLQLDITELTKKDFKESVQRIIQDKSFKDNILRLRALMKAHPIKPVDHAVWWIEHVVQYGGDHLMAPASKITWIEYYELKLIFILLIIVIAILILLSWIIKVTLQFTLDLYRVNIKLKLN